MLAALKESVRPFYLKYLYSRIAPSEYPEVFHRWREYPSAILDSNVGHLLPERGNAPDAVFLPMADWHSIRQRTQHLASGLARLGHRCIYLNPHLGREFPNAYPFSPKRVVSVLEPGVVELHVHLAREPVFHHRSLSPGEEQIVARDLTALLRQVGSAEQILIVSFPLWTGVAAHLKQSLGSRIVYDCHDLLEGFDDIGAGVLGQEQDLVRVADLVVFSAERLFETHTTQYAGLAEKSVVIRNAADSSDFTMPEPTSGVPTIGYVGSLNSWFDSDLVAHAARVHPEWRFVMVGPEAGEFRRTPFDGLDNVEFVGEVPHREVPAWLAQFHVATIPFRRSPLTDATNPVKLYEYFACGLPVVSSRLEEVERYADLVYLAEGAGEFVQRLEDAAAERDLARRLARRRVANSESWSERCRSLRSALDRIAY
jgi:glycosyltransferase involved in cell wall biosynthesis